MSSPHPHGGRVDPTGPLSALDDHDDARGLLSYIRALSAILPIAGGCSVRGARVGPCRHGMPSPWGPFKTGTGGHAGWAGMRLRAIVLLACRVWSERTMAGDPGSQRDVDAGSHTSIFTEIVVLDILGKRLRRVNWRMAPWVSDRAGRWPDVGHGRDAGGLLSSFGFDAPIDEHIHRSIACGAHHPGAGWRTSGRRMNAGDRYGVDGSRLTPRSGSQVPYGGRLHVVSEPARTTNRGAMRDGMGNGDVWRGRNEGENGMGGLVLNRASELCDIRLGGSPRG